MSEPFIHPTAVISPEAKIGNRVSIGAYSIIEKDCVIGDNCIIDAHVKIARYSIIGENCRINFGAVIGDLPQDYSFNPDTVSYTRIGNSVTIREYVTIHRATVENGETSVGDNSMLMLLWGVVTVIITAIFVCLWFVQLYSGETARQQIIL